MHRAILTTLLLTACASAIVEHKERYLGPTGMFGFTFPKDITVVKIEPGSPADGIIKSIESLPDSETKTLTFDQAVESGGGKN